MAFIPTFLPGGTLLTEVTATAAQQELTISGLDGNSHGKYYIEGLIIVPASTATIYSWRPNGLTTNQSSRLDTDGGGSGAPSADLAITGSINVTLPRFKLRCWIDAQTTYGGVTTWRLFETFSWATFSAGNRSAAYIARGQWEETSTNITSLVLRASSATGIQAGSTLQVYTPTKKFPA